MSVSSHKPDLRYFQGFNNRGDVIYGNDYVYGDVSISKKDILKQLLSLARNKNCNLFGIMPKGILKKARLNWRLRHGKISQEKLSYVLANYPMEIRKVEKSDQGELNGSKVQYKATEVRVYDSSKPDQKYPTPEEKKAKKRQEHIDNVKAQREDFRDKEAPKYREQCEAVMTNLRNAVGKFEEGSDEEELYNRLWDLKNSFANYSIENNNYRLLGGRHGLHEDMESWCRDNNLDIDKIWPNYDAYSP